MMQLVSENVKSICWMCDDKRGNNSKRYVRLLSYIPGQ